MKPGRIIPSFVPPLVAALGVATGGGQIRAQVAWSSVDSACVVQSGGESLASIDAAHGTVSFKTGAAGDIKLTCPVRSVHQHAPNRVNDLGITFYMNKLDQCFILADLLRLGSLFLSRPPDAQPQSERVAGFQHQLLLGRYSTSS
jgi:hypothetical protein